MLGNLNGEIQRKKLENKLYYDIACKIIDRIFDSMFCCLENNKPYFSKDGSIKKIGALDRSFMLGALPRTQRGVKEYVRGMFPNDIVFLMDGIKSDMNELYHFNILDMGQLMQENARLKKELNELLQKQAMSGDKQAISVR